MVFWMIGQERWHSQRCSQRWSQRVRSICCRLSRVAWKWHLLPAGLPEKLNSEGAIAMQSLQQEQPLVSIKNIHNGIRTHPLDCFNSVRFRLCGWT